MRDEQAHTHTREDQRQRTEFFEEGKRLDAHPKARHLAGCWLCGLSIDYTVDPSSTADSHDLDHDATRWIQLRHGKKSIVADTFALWDPLDPGWGEGPG